MLILFPLTLSQALVQPQLCIFCSLAFGGKRAAVIGRHGLKNQRRHLNSSKQPYQSAGAATARVEQNEESLDEQPAAQDSFRYQYNTQNDQRRGLGQFSREAGQESSGRWNLEASRQRSFRQTSLSPHEERSRQALLNRNGSPPHEASQRQYDQIRFRPSQNLTAAEERAREALFDRANTSTTYTGQSAGSDGAYQGQQRREPFRRNNLIQWGQNWDTKDNTRSRYQGSGPDTVKYNGSIDSSGRTQRQGSFGPRYNIRYNEQKSRNGAQDDAYSREGSGWKGLVSEYKAPQVDQVQTEPPVTDYQRQLQQRWESASNGAYVPLARQRQDDSMRSGFARRECYVCGSTEHLARDCSQSNPRSTNQRTSTRERNTSLRRQGGRDAVEWTPRQQDKREKDRRRSNFIYEDDFDEEMLPKAESRKTSRTEAIARKAERKAQGPPIQIYIPAFVSVTNLATLIKVNTEDLVKKMARLGYGQVAHDEVLNAENAGLIAMEYNYEAIPERDPTIHDLLPQPIPDDESLLPLRPPVVTIMGHVDHGKTTILDYLRKSSVAAGEFGGITQHIGAFSVPLESGRLITFLDTPGHAAFEVMRKRGATVTDIVVLVVAADDSVKPQTIEAIKHAKSADVPIIVAINKMDKEEANPDRVKGDLARHGIDVEDFGGDTQVIPVSGKTGLGIADLEEAIITQSELLDHRAPADGPVEGWILESTTKRAGGRVATVLVKRGTLVPGNLLVAGTAWTRVRVLRNEAGVAIDSAPPGHPVEVDGWRRLPAAGDQVLQAPTEQKATDVVAFREERVERMRLAADTEAINEFRRVEQERREREAAAAAQAKSGPGSAHPAAAAEVEEEGLESKAAGPAEVKFLIKGDVTGSVEAVVNSISALAHPEVMPCILRSGVGAVSEFDVEHAAAASATIIGFNTKVEAGVMPMAERKGVDMIEQNVIYRLVEEVKAKLSERLKPSISIRVLGEAEVAQEFEIGVGGRKTMKIAGCKVRNGTVNRTSKVKVLRGDREVVFDGECRLFFFCNVLSSNAAQVCSLP